MEAKLEQDLLEQLEIAEHIIREGRKPTEAERARFLELQSHMEGVSPDWRERLADAIDRLAAALEGMGI